MNKPSNNNKTKGSDAPKALDDEEGPVEHTELEEEILQPVPVVPEGAIVVPVIPIAGPSVAPGGPIFPFLKEGVRHYKGLVTSSPKRPPPRASFEGDHKRPRVGLKELTKGQLLLPKPARRRRALTTVDSDVIRARAHVELSDLLMENSRTNVHFTIEEITRLNDHIRNAGNVRNDITISGLSLSVLVRQAEELWKEMRSKYNTLAAEASTERAERLLLEERVKALEVHNDSHSFMEVEDQVPLSEFHALREQNAVLLARVEELTKTIAELATAKPISTDREVALESEASSLREQNLALSAEVAALKEGIPTRIESPLPKAATASSSGLTRSMQEVTSLRKELNALKEAGAKKEKLNLKKNKKSNQKKLEQEKGGASNANLEPVGPGTPSASQGEDDSPARVSKSDNQGSDDDAGANFTVVNRKKARKPRRKPRSKSEAIAIKANEPDYGDLLRRLRTDDGLKDLGEATKTVRRTRQNELLLILKKGAKPSCEYARLVEERVGSDEIKIRSLGAETTLQCKNLDETVTAKDLLDAISTQCLTGTLSTPVQLRKYRQGTQTATFKLPAATAAMVLKVGKIKVNWSVCPVTVVERPTVCFRCLEFGHRSWACKGPDRSKLCRRCGAEGHQSKDCKDKAKCLICTGDGGSHATGSYNCPSFKSAMEKLRPCK